MRWILAVMAALGPATLSAQTGEPSAYVFGGVSIPWQQGVTTDEYRTYLAAPGGWSAGMLLGAGARVSRRVSIEAEWHRTGVMEATEPSRYFITYSARRRDTMVAGGIRFHLPAWGHVALEPVGMFEFVREETWLAQRREFPGAPPDGNLSDHVPFVNSWGYGLAAGADLRIGSGSVAALPGLRVHRFWRGEEAISTWPGGRTTWGLEVLASVRVDF